MHKFVLLDSGLAESILICCERVLPLSTGLGVLPLALTSPSQILAIDQCNAETSILNHSVSARATSV